MLAQEGGRAPEARRGGRLEIDHPVTTKTLAALSLVGSDLADLRQFSNRLARDADAWMRRGGFSERGRISRRDADLIWRSEFGSGRQNSLADYRRDGGR